MAKHLRTWKDAQEVLGKRDSRKVANNTYLKRTGEDEISLLLHSTYIVRWTRGVGCLLNSGGWRTYTTKERMNRFSPFSVRSDRGTWWCSHRATRRIGDYEPVNPTRWVFEDGITLHEDGTVSGAGEDPTKDTKLRKKIKGYCAKFMDALEGGKVPAPSGGDCWYCCMVRSDTGKPLGERVDTLHPDGTITQERNTDHLTSHMQESYYVPSLLVNALKAGPCSRSMWWYLGSFWDTTLDPSKKAYFLTGHGNERPRVEKCLRKYISRQLGLAV